MYACPAVILRIPLWYDGGTAQTTADVSPDSLISVELEELDEGDSSASATKYAGVHCGATWTTRSKTWETALGLTPDKWKDYTGTLTHSRSCTSSLTLTHTHTCTGKRDKDNRPHVTARKTKPRNQVQKKKQGKEAVPEDPPGGRTSPRKRKGRGAAASTADAASSSPPTTRNKNKKKK